MTTTSWEIKQGNCLDVLDGIPDESIHCVVTSPPYFLLRNYGVDGQIGQEKTPDEYVNNLVEVFRKVRRVLRKDGTIWLNVGDSFVRDETNDLKPKDLIMIPFRVALALQKDGWWMRSDIIWSKTNAIPEPVKDRPTRSHEYVFLLTKSSKYFYDYIAIREPAKTKKWPGIGPQHSGARERGEKYQDMKVHEYRNTRSVWEITPQHLSEAHHAVMPMKLAERCILAGTSERGCCSKCGSPRIRNIQKGKTKTVYDEDMEDELKEGMSRMAGSARKISGSSWKKQREQNPDIMVGWKSSCSCNAEIKNCVVLDPFTGSGTTLIAAMKNGRDSVGIELNKEYIELAKKRIGDFLNNPKNLSVSPDSKRLKQFSIDSYS